ncbi:hypothetical protein BGZ60DRAFT_399608 [Tricladium varicosporioides]|nr:hypothetical protein BGZ60DRAFT_399608 [Hymenoscyphus varicosporioides]
MEEEILRQIREEGLLDGIDLENIDVTQEDQISERIAEAFRRRQSERARQERARSRDTRETRERTRQSRTSRQNSRESSGDDTRAPRSRRAHSRTPSAVSNVSTVSALSQTAEPSRPPQSMSAAHAAHLEVQSSDEGRRRRRASSGSRSRSSTAPIPTPETQTRPAARSATDLSNRPQSMDLSAARPAPSSSSRSTTEPIGPRVSELTAPERSRESQRATSSSPRTRQPARMEGFPPASGPMAIRNRAAPPSAVLPPSSTSSTAIHSMADQSMVPLPLSPKEPSRNSLNGNSLSERATAFSSAARPSSSSGPSLGARNRAPLYPEPSITCARCAKPHIEYELHYNCAVCHDGNYNVCLSCYRKGDQDGNKVCLNWFGFGYSAWTKFERLIQSGDLPSNAEKPHMLTANRYLPPRMIPGGAEGRRTLTTEDPLKRLESGTFCAGCLAWANECYWRCDFCNDGDWGFCNLCVNQGKCCTHPLLPLTFVPPETDIPPISPIRDHHMPSSASILTGPNVMDIGRFKPLTFSTACDVCRCIIPPTSTRYHCFQCVSKVPNTQPGDYDICTTCYPKLVVSRRVSVENGNQGWRRCLQGHRMVIIGFQEKGGGQRRIIVKDLVGGRGLHQEPYASDTHSDLQTWSWADGKNIKLVSNNIMSSPPSTIQILGLTQSHIFPPDGGVGMTCTARWSWWPAEGANDELMFPRGAEIRECKDVNGEWFHGTYMGKRGLFPGPYVRIKDKGIQG